jgi:hypothetical protein
VETGEEDSDAAVYGFGRYEKYVKGTIESPPTPRKSY